MNRSRVHNPKYLEKYFTQFPNIIDDSLLSPFEFRLLIHYYRVGECWEGVRKTSQICKMSTGKVATCRKFLEEKGFITIEEKGDGIIIYLVDLSRKNLEKYSEGVHVVDSSVHVVDDRCSPGELKKNHSKNTIIADKSATLELPIVSRGTVTSITKTIEQRKKDFADLLIPYVSKFGKGMIRSFYNYWTEHSPNGKKMRFEKQTVFDENLRLINWHARNKGDEGGTSVPDKSISAEDKNLQSIIKDADFQKKQGMLPEYWNQMFSHMMKNKAFLKHFGLDGKQ